MRIPDRRLRRDDRGSVSVEMVTLVFPTMVILTVLITGTWRLTSGHLAVHAAAAAAARAATQQTTPTGADTAARQSATANLADGDLTCSELAVTTGLGDFHRGGSVTVTVTCQIALVTLTGLSLPGHATASATARAPIETYRELTP